MPHSVYSNQKKPNQRLQIQSSLRQLNWSQRSRCILYINLYSLHDTLGTTDRITDINKRNMHI